MRSVATIRISTLRWLLPIIFLYVLAGSLQYIGILSATLCNFIVLFLFLHVFQFYSSWKALRLEWPLLFFIILIFLLHDYYGSPLSYTLTYFYYLMCTVIVAVSGRLYAERFFKNYSNKTSEIFFKISKYFLFLQMVVTIIQSTFTQSYIDFSRASIGYEDAIFGTLFLQSDAALATVCELMILAVYILPSNFKDKFIITIMGIAVIFLGNSKAAQFVVLGLLAIIWLNFFFQKTRLYKYGFGFLIGVLVIFLGLVSYTSLSSYVFDFIQQAQYDYDRRDEWITAPRFAPIGEIFQLGVSWLGQGPLTYYNPINKTWLYNSGFSTIYVLYFDYGLLGFILYFSYQSFLIMKIGVNFVIKLFMFIVLLTYINFNFALTDISFIFIFNFVLFLIYKVKTSTNVKGKNVC